MKDYEIMDLLGRALVDGEIDALADQLASDCNYVSEYSGQTVNTAEKIIERMKTVFDCVEDESRYSYKRVSIAEILQKDCSCPMKAVPDAYLNEYALLLYQFNMEYPCAVVSAMVDRQTGLIRSILLSRNTKAYNVSFFAKEVDEDSPLDIPSTVTPFTPHDRQVKEYRSILSGQNLDDIPKEITGDCYIWEKADEYLKSWLEARGYNLLESQVFDDCIGYRCNRNNYAYTVYMFAYGKRKSAQIDGDYCKKLLDYDFSVKSTVLVVYLNVKRRRNGAEVVYEIGNYAGKEDHDLELWRISYVAGQFILVYYPRKEMVDTLYKLMYAFNNNDLDVYDTIVCRKNPAFFPLEPSGAFLNCAFYTGLFSEHEQYGDMKMGYVRFNDVVYSAVPYLEGLGFFSFNVNNAGKIKEVIAYPFKGRDTKVADFIKTDEHESSSMYDHIPRLSSVSVLPAVNTERFALKLFFDNGECRKFVLPIGDKKEEKEVVQYDEHVFTDKIWYSATVKADLVPEIQGYATRRSVVEFKNGYFLSNIRCYEESTPYTEPVVCDEVVYEDERYQLTRIWKWAVKAAYKDKETGLLKILISGNAFNTGGISTFATMNGERMTSMDFDFMDDFSDGLARVSKNGYGYGFVDEQMRVVIPMIYENAWDFTGGRARVKRAGEWYFIDKTGKEMPIEAKTEETRYQEVGAFSEGMCRVSILKLRIGDLAYHTDYDNIAGTWGFINEAGEEVISPQYIYANDFSNGIAIVCKGKWTIDPKWDNEHNRGRYWTEEELWGAIDLKGNTAIPFMFDEITNFNDVNDIFMAHYGGWKEGHWGVIDVHGNWLADPIFEDIDYEFHNGLFAFYKEDKWNGDDVPLGIYDINQHKVVFEPQFYDVSFRDDGWIEVEVFDEKLGRNIEKLIDLDGREKFPSIYSSIYTWKTPYEVVIRDEKGDRHGLIDEDGQVILPCEYSVEWDGFDYERKRMIFAENDKQGIRDFSGTVIIPPKYHKIINNGKPFYYVQVGNERNHTEGLIDETGKEIIPCIYQELRWYGDRHLLCIGKNGCEMMVLTEKRKE